MAENILEKADEQVAESIRKLSRATSAMAEAIDESAGAIKLAVKRSGDLAEELMDDTMQRVKRHPVEAMAATFTLGVIVGGFIGWMVSRRY
jgi:F0F1-type ATP synthase assembly protein I